VEAVFDDASVRDVHKEPLRTHIEALAAAAAPGGVLPDARDGKRIVVCSLTEAYKLQVVAVSVLDKDDRHSLLSVGTINPRAGGAAKYAWPMVSRVPRGVVAAPAHAQVSPHHGTRGCVWPCAGF